mgnify:CR=1 FL=1
MRNLLPAMTATLLFATLATAHAQPSPQWSPTRPVRLIVPFPPGGSTDLVARVVGQKMADAWGKQVVIDNRPGANGMIGSEVVAKSAKDGYTLMVNGANFVTSPSLYRKAPYDPLRDFEAISLIAFGPNVLVAHPSLPAKSVQELIAFAKAKPGEVTFASGGPGGAQHLAGELFNSLAGIHMTHIPYKGSAPGLTALIGGEVVVGFADMLITLPHVKSGKLRALAVTGGTRSNLIPELPTVGEAGLKGYAVTAWFGLLAPAGTPADIVNRIQQESLKAMGTPALKERLLSQGAIPSGNTPAEFARFIAAEAAKWAKVVKDAGIKAD